MVIENMCTNGMMNCDGILGQVIMGITSQTTGDTFITFLFVIFILLAIALMFGIRLEYTAILIMPILLGLMIVSGEFVTFGFLIMIYLAIILTGNFILK